MFVCTIGKKKSWSRATLATGSHARKALAGWCNRGRAPSIVNWLNRFHNTVVEGRQRRSGHSPTDRPFTLAASTSALMVVQVVIGLPIIHAEETMQIN